MIGLCGLGGVGKTTIAKDIEKEEKNQKVFEKVIMATVSQEMNIGQIQDQIIEKLGMQLNERTEEVKASRLYRRLENEKNMLLILDDLWQELDLGKVGIPFGDVERYSKINEGCKILLTSRNETLLSKSMKCQKVITVGVLLEDEAWELFQSIAKLSIESSSPDFTYIANEIVLKCGGLPLAIATAAKALKDKNIDGWRDYLARLKHPLARSVSGIKEVDTILKLSYEALSRENKDIFLLSAMLSHDPSIEDLLMYSVGLDILKHTQNMGDARNAIFHIVGKLKSLNLFLDSFSGHHFTMHDVFRDVALSIASEELKAVIVWHRRLDEWPPDEIDPECCKGICLQESDICDLPEELHGPKLEFFFLNSKKYDLTIPNMFFKCSEKLKVLAITNVHFSSLPSLVFLQRLKELCLHSCLLEDITEIRSLRKLKVLSLAYSKIERLPIELAELTSLQMLNLSHCSNLKEIPQTLLSSLKKLEVLYMGNSFHQWKVEGSSEAYENASLDELKDLPISSLDIQIPNVSMLPENLFLKMNLTRYKIFIGKSQKWQRNYGTSKILKLWLEGSIDLTAQLRNLLKGVEDLHLYGSNGQENVLYNLDVSGFPCLRHLQIERNDDIKYIVLNSAHHEDAFPSLESLELKNLNALENLCEGPNDIVFGQLHTLKMVNLLALTRDFSIKDRATKNASNKIFKSLFNKVLLPKLEILELSNLNSSIELIWDDQLSHNSFSNLKRLMVEGCGFVKLMPIHVLKYLNNLEELEVRDCNMLEIVFDFEDLKGDKEMESSSVVVPMKKLRLWGLPKLKNVWSNHHGNVSFPSLRRVDVFDCESLTSIFPASIAKGMLCDLEELRIDQCGVDVIVAGDQVLESAAVTFEFPSLTSLDLFRLQKLRNFFPHQHTLKLPHLHRLAILFCDELEIFEKEVSSSSEIHEEESTLNSKYPLFSHHDEVIQELEELTLQGKQAEMIGSGQFPMHHFPNVKLLLLSAEKATTVLYRSLLKSFTKLEDLQLWGNFEKAFGGEDVARFPKLTLSNNFIMRSLPPSLVCLPNLTHLNVKRCDEWTSLMTSSIARSLVHLTRLSVDYCLEMEEIVTKQEGEDDEDNEIFFRKLEFLELTDLPRLRRFCCHNYTFRFPLLDKLVITRCPNFQRFSPGLLDMPSLKSVQLSQDWGEHHEIWDTNLNKTFYQQRYVKKNDQFPGDCCPQVEIPQIEGFVGDRATNTRCTNISRSLFSHNEDDAIMIKNDQFPVDCCPQVEIPQIEGFVEDRATNTRCTNISGSLFSHNEDDAIMIKNDQFPADCCPQVEIPQIEGFVGEVLLPKLKILELSNSNSLIPLIWDDRLLHNSFSNLKTLIVKSCGFVKLIPLHVLKSLNNLEELDVKDCGMLEKVFDFEDLNDYKEMESSSAIVPLKNLELMNLPKLKNVWSDHYQGNVSFPSLRRVDVYNCESLTSIFPASIAKGMLCDLEELQIRQCGVGVIVAKDQVPEPVAVTFGFPRLTSLLLYDLPKLRNFYPQKHTLEWPHLNQLSIQCCDELEIFEKEVEENMPDSKYPLLSHHKDIGNLESLRLQGKEVEKIGSGEYLTYHFPKLKLLHLSLEEESPFPSLQFWERSSNLGELMLSGDFEKALGGDNVAALAARFPKLTLKEISIMGSLTPSLVSSPNLTHLIVNWCRDWTTLMTSSIARSLVHLTRLSVGKCLEMEEIITKPEGEDDEDKEICFRKLEFLELDYLPRLKRFCRHNYTFRFPLLNELIIKECPKFKIFSPELIETPSLKSVQPREDWEKHHEIWDTDLNKIFYRQRYMTSRELVLDEDDAIMIRNEQFPADCWTQVEILRIKGFVEEWVTFPYTLLERFPKLNALHVENCFFKEIFPSHALSSNSFHNLTELKVSKCHHLVYLVVCSTVKSLVNLEILEIGDCEKMEEIVRNETNEGVKGQITFNRLRILKLTRLPKLKTQEDKEDVDIEDKATNTRCTNISRSLFSHNEVLLPKLERFELSHLLNNLISLIWDNKHLLESFSNLKTLIVQGCDFMKSMPLRVLEALKSLKKLEVSFCDKLEKVFGEMESSSGFVSLPLTHLEVNGCDGLTTLMTSSVALSLVSITHLSISNCNQIKEIITQQEGEDDEDREIIFNQMKLLELNFLPRLKRFCCHNYSFRFPLLNELSIKECPKFKIFSPGLIETPSLKSVQPRDDREKHHEIWDTDLNKIVYRQRYVTSRELVLDKDDAIMIRNDQFLVDCCPQVEILGVEGFVEEWVTFPYTLLERFPKLNELHVKNCSFD